MNPEALVACLASAPCLVIQVTSALIAGMLLFLVATGLTLVFGVLHVVNFSHGSFYMLGAYATYTIFRSTGSYGLSIAGTAVFVFFAAVLVERTLIRRIYGTGILLQLLVTYAIVLVIDDLVGIVFGKQYVSMGMPPAFDLPPIFLAGGVIPPFYAFLIALAAVAGIALWAFLKFTLIGKQVRATAENPLMLSTLGIDTDRMRTITFAVGCMLAGVAGALAAPVRALQPDMGLGILIDAFIVTVIGGMGSIMGALIASILIGVSRVVGTMAFPLFADGLMFFAMALVLIVRPQGLFVAGGGR